MSHADLPTTADAAPDADVAPDVVPDDPASEAAEDPGPADDPAAPLDAAEVPDDVALPELAAGPEEVDAQAPHSPQPVPSSLQRCTPCTTGAHRQSCVAPAAHTGEAPELDARPPPDGLQPDHASAEVIATMDRMRESFTLAPGQGRGGISRVARPCRQAARPRLTP